MDFSLEGGHHGRGGEEGQRNGPIDRIDPQEGSQHTGAQMAHSGAAGAHRLGISEHHAPPGGFRDLGDPGGANGLHAAGAEDHEETEGNHGHDGPGGLPGEAEGVDAGSGGQQEGKEGHHQHRASGNGPQPLGDGGGPGIDVTRQDKARQDGPQGPGAHDPARVQLPSREAHPSVELLHIEGDLGLVHEAGEGMDAVDAQDRQGGKEGALPGLPPPSPGGGSRRREGRRRGEAFPHQEEDRQGGHHQEPAGDVEGVTEAEAFRQYSPQEQSGHVPGEDGAGEHAQGEAGPVSWGVTGHQGGGGGDGAGEASLEEAEEKELPGVLAESHEAQDNGPHGGRPKHHALSPIAVGHPSPEGGGHGEGHLGQEGGKSSIEPDPGFAGLGRQFPEKIGGEGDGQGESAEGNKLGAPEDRQIPPPMGEFPLLPSLLGGFHHRRLSQTGGKEGDIVLALPLRSAG